MEPVLKIPVTRETIAACIDSLGRKYHALPEDHRANMSEQDVRDYFVTPLLEALGWGTVDPRERSAEKYLPRHGFSDYELCLPIGPDPKDPYLPVIYVEAKKFDALSPLEPDLFGYANRSEADKQVIEYADQFNFKRGEKIGWAILTNFQVFRVWDTRRNVLVESVDWFTDLKRDRTLEILFLLSRDQVAQDPNFRDLSNYRKLPDIDERFLTKLNEWRSALAHSIWHLEANRPRLGQTISERQSSLRSVVQRTLDRLIVIRTAEDRGLLSPQYRLQEMLRNFGGQDAVPLGLLENIQRNTFSYFDHHYNSKMFGPHLADEMRVHNSPLSNIIDEMCKANFAAMNADILGATYEQYLSQTIEIDAATDTPKLVVNLETRHEQGSYYTPRQIVQTIVDSTLGKYLYGTPSGQPEQGVLISPARKRIEDIQYLTVLDPACGSGSFLIYAFDVLFQFYSAERARLLREIEKKIEEIVSTGVPHLAAESQHDPELLGLRSKLELTRFAHARIIERHLYGVDLDPQAAEVASMNLLLKALTRDQRLPRILGDNVKVGNSLIAGLDISEQTADERFQQLVRMREQIHRETLLASENDGARQRHEDTIDRVEQEFRVLADHLNAALNESLRRNAENGWFSDPQDVRPFNWQVEFPERFQCPETDRGFMFVVGNPPYVGFHGFKEQKPFLRDTYSSATGKFDLYVPFLERGIRLTRKDGELSFICPSTFMKRGFGRNLRPFLLDQTTIVSLHDFQHVQVFRQVLNYTCIPVFRHSPSVPGHTLNYSEGDLGAPQRPYVQSKLDKNFWIFRFDADEALVNRIKSENKYRELGDSFLTSGVAEGIVTAKNSILLLHEREIRERGYEFDFLRPCVRGEDIKRYCVSWGGFYVFYPYELVDGQMQVVGESALLQRCPNLYAYLLQSREELASRTYFENTSKLWYEIWCPRDMAAQAADKIVVPELADRSQFAFVPDFFYVDTTCGFSPRGGVDPWYLLAILNSKAGEFLYRKTTVPKANGFLIYKTMFLNPFRVPAPDRVNSGQRTRISDLAQTVQNINMRCSAIENAFREAVEASLPVTDSRTGNFYRSYYSVPAYWPQRRLVLSSALELREPVFAIRVSNDVTRHRDTLSATNKIHFSYRSQPSGPWKTLIELEAIDENLKLFVLWSMRQFLSKNARKKSWKLTGRGASKRTVDVLLQSLVLPTWGFSFSSGAGTQEEITRQKIGEIMGELRKRFPEDELNPDVLETRAEDAEHEIDELAYQMYDFSPEERQLASGTMSAAKK